MGFLSEFRNLGFLSPGILSLGILSVGFLSCAVLSVTRAYCLVAQAETLYINRGPVFTALPR